MGAKAESWKRKPLGNAQPIPYQAHFSAAAFDRIKQGLVPRVMEDKWFIYFEGSSLFLHRSWTGQCVYRVDFTLLGDEPRVTSAICSTDMLSQGHPAYHARLLDFLIGNLLLNRGASFPRPSGLAEPSPGMFQHAIAGTAYPEKPIESKRLWRKFWR